MFITVFPPVLTPIPLRQADIIYIYIYYNMYITYLIIPDINIFIYISGQEHSAALCGAKRPLQDRRDARGGKRGPLCAR